jgi:hypothetical protein
VTLESLLQVAIRGASAFFARTAILTCNLLYSVAESAPILEILQLQLDHLIIHSGLIDGHLKELLSFIKFANIFPRRLPINIEWLICKRATLEETAFRVGSLNPLQLLVLQSGRYLFV